MTNSIPPVPAEVSEEVVDAVEIPGLVRKALDQQIGGNVRGKDDE